MKTFIIFLKVKFLRETVKIGMSLKRQWLKLKTAEDDKAQVGILVDLEIIYIKFGLPASAMILVFLFLVIIYWNPTQRGT